MIARPIVREIFRSIVTLALTFALLGGLLVVAWGWYSAGLVIKLQRYPVSVLPAAFGLKYETVEFTTEDGVNLVGWWVPAQERRDVDRPGAEVVPVPSDKTIVLCHGWGANRADILPHTVFLNQRGGYNLFYFDFRNHGDSGGEISSLGPLEMRDLEAALRFVREKKPAEARRTAFYGLSMGGAVALGVAAKDPGVAAVAAESAFSSFNDTVARFARLFYGVPRVPFVHMTLAFVRLRLGLDPEEFSPVRAVARIAPRPLFLLQGDADARMPASEGEVLFAAAGEPKTLWTIPGADHGEAAEKAGAEYQERLLKFYGEAFAGNGR